MADPDNTFNWQDCKLIGLSAKEANQMLAKAESGACVVRDSRVLPKEYQVLHVRLQNEIREYYLNKSNGSVELKSPQGNQNPPRCDMPLSVLQAAIKNEEGIELQANSDRRFKVPSRYRAAVYRAKTPSQIDALLSASDAKQFIIQERLIRNDGLETAVISLFYKDDFKQTHAVNLDSAQQLQDYISKSNIKPLRRPMTNRGMTLPKSAVNSYLGEISRENAIEILIDLPVNTYLIREADSGTVINYKHASGKLSEIKNLKSPQVIQECIDNNNLVALDKVVLASAEANVAEQNSSEQTEQSSQSSGRRVRFADEIANSAPQNLGVGSQNPGSGNAASPQQGSTGSKAGRFFRRMAIAATAAVLTVGVIGLIATGVGAAALGIGFGATLALAATGNIPIVVGAAATIVGAVGATAGYGAAKDTENLSQDDNEIELQDMSQGNADELNPDNDHELEHEAEVQTFTVEDQADDDLITTAEIANNAPSIEQYDKIPLDPRQVKDIPDAAPRAGRLPSVRDVMKGYGVLPVALREPFTQGYKAAAEITSPSAENNPTARPTEPNPVESLSSASEYRSIPLNETNKNTLQSAEKSKVSTRPRMPANPYGVLPNLAGSLLSPAYQPLPDSAFKDGNTLDATRATIRTIIAENQSAEAKERPTKSSDETAPKEPQSLKETIRETMDMDLVDEFSDALAAWDVKTNPQAEIEEKQMDDEAETVITPSSPKK